MGALIMQFKIRLTKANRTIYILKQALSTNRNVNVKVSMSLYEKQSLLSL